MGNPSWPIRVSKSIASQTPLPGRDINAIPAQPCGLKECSVSVQLPQRLIWQQRVPGGNEVSWAGRGRLGFYVFQA